MCPLERVTAEESNFFLPRAAGKPDAPEGLRDLIRNLDQARESLWVGESVDKNTRAVLGILLETLTRARLDGDKDFLSTIGLLDRASKSLLSWKKSGCARCWVLATCNMSLASKTPFHSKEFLKDRFKR